MQLGVGSFQHFEHLPPSSGLSSSHSSPGRGPTAASNGGPPPTMIIDHPHHQQQPLGLARKGSTASDASSIGGAFDDPPAGGFVPGGSPGGLLLLQRDMASILYLDVQQSSALIYDLIAILNQNAHHFDRSQPPEAQSDDAREKLHQLADFITEEIAVVKKVAPSWPNLGLWLMTKAFDCWIGHLT